MKRKTFDAVAMMRKIRDKLGKRYYGHSDVLLKDLDEIKQKYGLNAPTPNPCAPSAARRERRVHP
ncbi:MAG: hypothetical protein NTX06_09575 [Proteobacteria bacterium]|nr:hypothetical protein [Pseudomonadota bacterium]